MTTAGVVVAMIVVSFFAGSFILVNSVILGGMWALVAVGLALVFGVINIPNFAQGEFFMVGTFAGYFAFHSLLGQSGAGRDTGFAVVAPLIAIAIAAVAGGLLGVVLELAVFYPLRVRQRESWVMSSFVVTAGLSILLINVAQLLFGASPRGIAQYWNSAPVTILHQRVTLDRLAAVIIALIIISVFWIFLKFAPFGRAIRATAQDATGAAMVGISPRVVYTVTLALSASMAAVAGATLLSLFPATPTVGAQPLYVAWYVTILAGIGNIPGAVVGGFIVAFLQTVTSYYVGTEWLDVIPPGLIIVILILKPSGLFGSPVKGIWEQ